jgi:predicted DNA-binding transcriptional regulator AlpA
LRAKSRDVPLTERLLLTFPEVADYTRLSRTEILKRIDAGRFLKTIDGKRAKYFRQSIDDDLSAEMQSQRRHSA